MKFHIWYPEKTKGPVSQLFKANSLPSLLTALACRKKVGHANVELIIRKKNKSYDQILALLEKYPNLIVERSGFDYEKISPKIIRNNSINKMEYSRGEPIDEIKITFSFWPDESINAIDIFKNALQIGDKGCKKSVLQSHEADKISAIRNKSHKIIHHVKLRHTSFDPELKNKEPASEFFDSMLKRENDTRLKQLNDEAAQIKDEITTINATLSINEKKLNTLTDANAIQEIKDDCSQLELHRKTLVDLLLENIKKREAIESAKSEFKGSQGREPDEVIQLITSESEQHYCIDEVAFLKEIGECSTAPFQLIGGNCASFIQKCLINSMSEEMRNAIKTQTNAPDNFFKLGNYPGELAEFLRQLQLSIQIINDKYDEAQKKSQSKEMATVTPVFTRQPSVATLFKQAYQPILDKTLDESLKPVLLNLAQTSLKTLANKTHKKYLLDLVEKLNHIALIDPIEMIAVMVQHVTSIYPVDIYREMFSHPWTACVKKMISWAAKFVPAEELKTHVTYLHESLKKKPMQRISLNGWMDEEKFLVYHAKKTMFLCLSDVTTEITAKLDM